MIVVTEGREQNEKKTNNANKDMAPSGAKGGVQADAARIAKETSDEYVGRRVEVYWEMEDAW